MQELVDAFSRLVTSFSKRDLPTSSISLISHAHGRQRREERGIERRELQEAIKYGRKERANPGRDGKPRWRYTHKGVVYITDETSRHEITSWRLDDALEAPPAPLGPGGGGGAGTSHVVVIVDSSGSMRKEDVPGYTSRTAAVYDCLARDLVEPQLKAGGADIEVSLIEMSDEAHVVLERAALDSHLLQLLKARATSRARSHGNYLPALDAALDLLAGDAARQSQLFLVFLSDGAPSDHTEMACTHGYYVWQPDYNAQGTYGGRGQGRGKQPLQRCPISNACRNEVRRAVAEECVSRVRRLGDLLGRERVFVGTVAFGPPDEDYSVLQKMAAALPRSSFQKLGLSVNCLRTAFTSLTSSLTTLRTEAGGGGGHLTLRTDIAKRGERQTYEERTTIADGDGWDLYCGSKCLAKRKYNPNTRSMEDAPFMESELVRGWERSYPRLQRGIAHRMYKFGEGAERVVFQCTEVVSFDGGVTAVCVGPRLVAKSTRFKQHLEDASFHRTFCKTQGEAEELAQLFNRRLAGGPAWQVHFLPCAVYTILDWRYSISKRGVLDILVEEELEGKFTKWNNNAGGVAKGMQGVDNSLLGVIAEGDEEEDEEGGEEEVSSGASQGAVEHVPQCFSHFTYYVTGGRKLVCDLQGVWNPVDGFTMTDPVIHHSSGSKHNGATDKGPEGFRSFFKTHECNALCRRLGLPRGP
ncbi:hypothetical protein Agub_g595 [Astrephomene gubernaculifera]|uniref:Alpha-type protein kinase domain-containing protein n=1 Tax=Astrephomene gubernaculifera TaxID=47775 RepID=A0AAD3HGK3_9CHLO|nr:hypothetical protein Agub_g595 [Astrephomene gubernaculifera]